MCRKAIDHNVSWIYCHNIYIFFFSTADIGGQLGLAIGASIITVFEFLQYFIKKLIMVGSKPKNQEDHAAPKINHTMDSTNAVETLNKMNMNAFGTKPLNSGNEDMKYHL